MLGENMFSRMVKCQGQDQEGKTVPVNKCEFGLLWALLGSTKAEDKFESFLAPKLGTWDELKDGFHHDGAEMGAQSEFLVLPTKGGVTAPRQHHTNVPQHTPHHATPHHTLLHQHSGHRLCDQHRQSGQRRIVRQHGSAQGSREGREPEC